MKFDCNSTDPKLRPPIFPADVYDGDGILIDERIFAGDTETGVLYCRIKNEDGTSAMNEEKTEFLFKIVHCKPPLTLKQR